MTADRSLLTKYSQPEVVEFWRDMSLAGLQLCEQIMIQKYAPVAQAILDLGCGGGRGSYALVPQGRDVIGLELSGPMVRMARKVVAEVQRPPKLIQGNMCQLPLVDNQYDLALILIAALQHVPTRKGRQQALTEIARVLKPEGVLILAIDNLAPALRCYFWWGWSKLIGRKLQVPQEDLGEWEQADSAADAKLAQRRNQYSALGWHLRGLARTLRRRTKQCWLDTARSFGLSSTPIGDTIIRQVSLTVIRGSVYYHLYEHTELLEDAHSAGLSLLGYHSSNELSESKQFIPRIRQLDKQVLYAFRRVDA